MTNEEIHEQIKLMHERADERRAEARATDERHERIRALAEARGIDEAATMLSGALAKSEAAPATEPGTRTLLLPAKESFAMTFSGVAMTTGIEIAAFGSGLWIVETVERSESDPRMAHVTAFPVAP